MLQGLVYRTFVSAYKIIRLSNTLKILGGKNTDLVEQYKKNVHQMFADFISCNYINFYEFAMAKLIN